MLFFYVTRIIYYLIHIVCIEYVYSTDTHCIRDYLSLYNYKYFKAGVVGNILAYTLLT